MLYLIEQTDGTFNETTFENTKLWVFDEIRAGGEFIKSIWACEWQKNSITQEFSDVSEDIANEFFNKFSQDYSMERYVPEFIQDQLTIAYIDPVLREQDNQVSDYEDHNTMSLVQQGIS